MKVYFIGAGPGDPELITVKAQRRIRECGLVLYAGSLVPPPVLEDVAPDAEVINTATLSQEPIIEHMRRAHEQGIDVARVHSGDPSIYGAVGEQIRRLRELGIDYEIIPGVTAASAAAAEIGCELTLPDVAQTVIMTRYAGKTSMPDGEALSDLARHGATLVIHLGVTRLHHIVEDLRPHYGGDCPVAVLCRVGWEDGDRVEGTLDTIVERVRAKGFTRTTIILVGRVLAMDGFSDSFLYRADKAHYYRPRGRTGAARGAARLPGNE
ncbi:precorrin-4 C(11)-methyltransferase [Arhodomonas sp. AD133]|uniref:precorrin-4 C(11)-methyltransferase n=1 Tax=Arhodomonas sp. AD133 TaxID=3415009 RepID=UPI003EBAF9F4